MLARATGASARRAMSAPARPARTTTIPSPARRIVRSWAMSSQQVLLGEEEVGLGVLASGHAAAGHEVARVGDLRALVGELAVADELLQIRGNLFLAQREA